MADIIPVLNAPRKSTSTRLRSVSRDENQLKLNNNKGVDVNRKVSITAEPKSPANGDGASVFDVFDIFEAGGADAPMFKVELNKDEDVFGFAGSNADPFAIFAAPQSKDNDENVDAGAQSDHNDGDNDKYNDDDDDDDDDAVEKVLRVNITKPEADLSFPNYDETNGGTSDEFGVLHMPKSRASLAGNEEHASIPARSRRAVSEMTNSSKNALAVSDSLNVNNKNDSTVTNDNHRRGQSMDMGARAQENVEKIDILRQMKDGMSLLKYGKFGFPHFRPFTISEDNTKIQWFSKNKKGDRTSIDIRDIDEVVIGQKTKNFSKHRAPELARSSFSILYNNRQKSLDVIAKTPEEFAAWVHGINALRKAAELKKLELVKEILIQVPDVEKKQRPRVDVDPAAIRNEIAFLKERFDYLNRKSQDSKYLYGGKFELINRSKKRVNDQLEGLSKNLGTELISDADYELWVISVELESLENLLFSS